MRALSTEFGNNVNGEVAESSQLGANRVVTKDGELRGTREEKREREEKGRGKAVHVKRNERKKPKRETVVNSGNQGEKKKKKKYGKKANMLRLGLMPPPELPQKFREFIERLGGQDLKLVIMKQIRPTDLNPHHDRFAIPENQLQNKFLTEKEETILCGLDDDGHKQKVDAVVPDPSLDGRVSRLGMGRWNKSYVLTHGWNEMVPRHAETLNVGAIVQLWSFRKNGELWFVLLKVHDGEGDGRVEGGDSDNDESGSSGSGPT